MSEVEPPPPDVDEPILARRPWTVAALLSSAGTPAAVIAAQILPPPFDAFVAWPLVLVDRLVEPRLHLESHSGSAWSHIAAAGAGIVLTWLFYVLVARILIRRLARTAHQPSLH